MNVETIYLQTIDNGGTKVSILVDGIWYIAIKDWAANLSHFVELDNCTLGKDIIKDDELNIATDKNKKNIHT